MCMLFAIVFKSKTNKEQNQTFSLADYEEYPMSNFISVTVKLPIHVYLFQSVMGFVIKIDSSFYQGNFVILQIKK